jgi:hypothetical protein
MVRKPRKKPVLKTVAVKSPPPSAPTEEVKREKTDYLISHNGTLVEQLYDSEVWREVLEPLISETVSSVSGRYTNGVWHHGDFTRKSPHSLDYLKGYQTAMMDFSNRLREFVLAKENLKHRKVREDLERRAPMVSPMENEHEEE